MILKLLSCFNFSVREIKITKHLADTEVDEDSDAMFTCEINYTDEDAQWLLNEKVLFTNEVNTITHEGKVHKLRLKNLAPQDGGTITFQVRKVKESVTLKVKGKQCHSLSFNNWPQTSWLPKLIYCSKTYNCSALQKYSKYFGTL